MIYIVKLFSQIFYFFNSTPVTDFNYNDIPELNIES